MEKIIRILLIDASEPMARAARSWGESTPEGGCPIRIHALLLLSTAWLLTSADLPLHGPVPLPRPDAVDISVEKAKPLNEKDKAETEEPIDAKKDEANDTPPPPPLEKEDPALFAACTAELQAMGVEFREIPPIEDGNGCGIDRPLEVKALGGGVTLSPPGTLRCRTAVNLARWTRDIVKPMLEKAQPKESLAEVNQASSYVCRKRNNAETGKMSEHAHGSAVDIAGFTFKSGGTFTIAPREEDSTLNGAFQRAIASAACLYFSTVLDPGSDKAHETHLHLDTLKRRGGYRYCW
jgi:hypothetical protein